MSTREKAKAFGEANRVEGGDGWQLMADFAASETNELVTVLRELVEAVEGLDIPDKASWDIVDDPLKAARDLLKSLEPTTSKPMTANEKD